MNISKNDEDVRHGRTSGRWIVSVILLLNAVTAVPAWAQDRQEKTSASSPPWACHTIDSLSQGADGVRLADANGDDLTNLVTGWEEGGLVRVPESQDRNGRRRRGPPLPLADGSATRKRR